MAGGWISLTFDDALDEHLDHVVPALRKHELRGTFYIHLSAQTLIRRRGDWGKAASEGDELGNHTIFHPADARKSWVREGNAIDWYSIDRMRLELETANAWLSEIDGRSSRTFAYPCSNSFVGRRGWMRRAVERLGFGRTRVASWIDRNNLDWGATSRSYENIVGELFAAGRGGGLVCGQPLPPTGVFSRTRLPSVAVERWSLNQLQRFTNDAVHEKTWGILQFHGVGGGHHMDCDLDVFHEFVAWLGREHQDRVITVLEGAHRLWPASEANRS